MEIKGKVHPKMIFFDDDENRSVIKFPHGASHYPDTLKNKFTKNN